jgi:hypothetical protein
MHGPMNVKLYDMFITEMSTVLYSCILPTVHINILPVCAANMTQFTFVCF